MTITCIHTGILKKGGESLFDGMEFDVEERPCGEDGQVKRVVVLRGIPPPRKTARTET